MSDLFMSNLFSGSISNTYSTTTIDSKKKDSIKEKDTNISAFNIEKLSQNTYNDTKGNNFSDYGYYTDQNSKYKNTMEDYVYCEEKFCDKSSDALFTLYDGHGGNNAAEYVSKRFPKILSSKLQNKDVNIPEVLSQSFLDADKELKFYAAENEGTTASVIYLNDNKIFSANVGDSSSYLIDIEEKTVKKLSFDHKVSDSNENQRIVNLGGTIKNNRVNSILVLTRSLGDHFLSKHGIIAEPYIDVSIVTNRKYKYIVMASDGVWDVLEASSMLSSYGFENNEKCSKIAKNIVEESKKLGSKDNICCIVIKL